MAEYYETSQKLAVLQAELRDASGDMEKVNRLQANIAELMDRRRRIRPTDAPHA